MALADAGAVVTEKLATKLGLGVGDAIVFAEQDDLGNATATTYSVPVAGIIENYIGDYAFMTPETYERTFGEEADNLTVYARATTDEGERQALSEALRATGAVDTVAFNDEVIDSYKQMLRSVNMVVVVLVVAAAALAFIVLYNLTNINITERAREIATLKVLGFTPREVNAYIFREIVLLAILGALVGLALGIVLEGFVVVTAEVDQVMFGRTIPLGQLRHRVCAHHGVHRHRHARHAPQTRPHRHGGEPEVQRVRLCDLENVPKWTRFAQSNLARFKKAHFPRSLRRGEIPFYGA